MDSKSVIVLFGGTSEERRVSVATAQNLATVLSDAQFWFMDAKGEIFSVTKESLLGFQNPFVKDFTPSVSPLAKGLEDCCTKRDLSSSVFYFGLHGGEGENGDLQRILEKRKIAFTGSGSEASHHAFEKDFSRKVAKENSCLVADAEEFTSGLGDQKLLDFLESRFEKQGPQVLKPIDGGSSIGVFFLHESAEIEDIAVALRSVGKRKYLAESFISGKELTVGVLDQKGSTFALPASEVRTEKNRKFDYEGKYLGKGTQEITPAEITAKELEVCQKLAVKMHQALKCYGYSRTDMILTDKGPYYLETNTLPGLTKASFIPQQLAVAKISFASFVEGQLELARKRYH